MSESTRQALDLMKVLTRLIEVLQQEIATLHDMDPSGIQQLQQDKIVLTAAYESLLGQLRGEPEALRNLPQELREQVMQVTRDFQDTLTENARALYAVKEANDRLFNAVAKALEEQRSHGSAYSSRGSLASGATIGHRSATSVALDQRL